MRKLEQVRLPSLALLLALFTLNLATGCGGGQISASNAMVSSPTPSPSASPSPTPTGNIPPNAQTIPDIQKLTGWETCDAVCTNTPVAVFSMTQGVASPSLSGSSARFQLLSGTQPFGGALWFKFLGAQNSATHFIYDLFFYVDNPSAAQALEFNVSQSGGGNRYNFSTQCDIAGGAWRVWEPVAKHWVASSVACTQPGANSWHHLIWEFERDSAGNTVFTAVTLNGHRGLVSLSMPHTADSSSGVDVAFQSDANRSGTPYSVWLDKINLTYW